MVKDLKTKDGIKTDKIMKNTKSILLMTAAIMLAASCEQMSDNTDIQQVELTPMTFNAGVDSEIQVETKTTYSGRNVSWEAEDAISVFFCADQITKQQFTATALYDDNRKATFEGLGDETATSYVAVYPHSDATAYDGTNLSVTIPSVQVGVAQGFASGANTSVACSTDNSLVFKNVGALIAFRFESPADAAQTASVTFKAKTAEEGKYYGLTGASSVALQEGIPVASEGNADYVTVLAPEGGFECGSNKVYYAVVYPGEINGFEVTFTTNDSTPITSVINNDTPATLKRNFLLSLAVLPKPYDLLPEEITITLDMTTSNGPFEQAWVAMANQTEEGETYTYKYAYTYNGQSMTTDLDFVFCKGSGTGYQRSWIRGANAGRFLPGANADSWIQLPGIKGRYLKSVTMYVSNTPPNTKRFKLQRSATDNAAYYNSPVVATEDATVPVPTSVTFPTTDPAFGNLKTTIAGNSYCMLLNTNNIHMSRITLVYTKAKPE